MGVFVLVHCAFHGGWCWQLVERDLRVLGHTTYAPTLSGLAERADVEAGTVSLETHIADVVSVIESHDLTDVTIVGHSYGGFPVRGAIDRVPDRVRAAVYLDAYLPLAGESVLGLTETMLGADVGSEVVRAIRAAASANGGLIPPDKAASFHVRPQHRASVDERLTGHPIGSFEQPLSLHAPNWYPERVAYVLATGWPGVPFESMAARFAEAYDVDPLRWPSGHELMVDVPEQLADWLADLA
jgi:pimeloyl-ACP methyl ester carboxylesterase